MVYPEVWSYLTWDVRNISFINELSSECISFQNNTFYLKLCMKSYECAKHDCLEMYLINEGSKLNDHCSFEVSTYLKDIRGENHFFQHYHYVPAKSESATLIWTVTFVDLFENSSINWKRSLHFVCMFGPECIYQKRVEKETLGSRNSYSRKNHLEKLSLELSRMFHHDLSGDVSLLCEGKKIFAYKNILSARSPTFKELFQSEIGRKSPCEVTISGVDYFSLRRLLAFIYSGSVSFYHETVDSAVRLYETAEIYKVCGLQRECTKYLLSKLDEVTACRLLLFAFVKKDEDFLSSATSFIIKKNILKSKGWTKFSCKHPELAIRTYFAFLKHYRLTRSNFLYYKKHQITGE